MKSEPDVGPAMLLSDRIRLALADEITTGALLPGAQLDEQLLGDRFGASRTPVREALRQLAASGLVEMRPRRGAVVAEMTAERIFEMFELSAEIEAMCIRLAAWRMTPVERSALRQIHEDSAFAVARGDVDEYDRLNWRFHDAIYQGTHNAYIVEQAKALRERMAAFRRAQLRKSGRPERSRHEHGELVEAVMRGDGEEAAKLMRAHMFNASSALEGFARQVEKKSY
ncbi:GntR family transcriptional regulator [Novosphingobium taihuense]|uniref:DNA-binding GntR family transcriptional regulator n=1 Tax=Novosphingobium taihuense TaxID=260085 RepID=A0A7W7EU50_9SPHN|nr:GntR family transcriptional regulator [Novosphingobium taihuense]MBB4613907.1 DNA-binding GntR family transcriptional regulator [Novosphingobium taihuense]TWH86758.1 DNA-binding GntR family transcriptional regulator [Novosphingobium taihuense]